MQQWVMRRFPTADSIVEIGRKSRSWIKVCIHYCIKVISHCIRCRAAPHVDAFTPYAMPIADVPYGVSEYLLMKPYVSLWCAVDDWWRMIGLHGCQVRQHTHSRHWTHDAFVVVSFTALLCHCFHRSSLRPPVCLFFLSLFLCVNYCAQRKYISSEHRVECLRPNFWPIFSPHTKSSVIIQWYIFSI